MSGSVDERVVEMNFQGNSFLSGVGKAITALSQLKNGLSGLKGSESDINNLDEAGKRFSLAGIANSLQGISSKFLSLNTIGVTALANITNKAVNAGITLVKSLTLDPIAAGFQKYELGINATQRIIANTGVSLKAVTAVLNDLNTYSNQTIYNFEEMTQAIGQFTAAGVPVNAAAADIKGMSNAAALTGASMNSLQSAFYQMSQAMAAGVIRLQDFNSLQNAGVADGKEFQQAFQETADSMGHNVDALIAKQGGFRNSLQKGWLTAGVFSKTMLVMAGTLNKTTGQTEAYSIAQLKAMGYTESQAASLRKLSEAAIETATKTRSFSQLLDNLKDDASTAWAHVFQAIIGNLPEATAEFTKLSNITQNVFLGPVNNLATLITKFRQLGGIDLITQGIGEGFHTLSAILGTLKAAFQEVFPSNGNGGAAQGLIKAAIAFQDFFQKLTPTKATLNDIKDVFVAVFSVIKLGITIVGDLFGVFTHVGSSASSAGGGFLSLLASIAKFVTRVTDAIRSGTALATFFRDLEKIVALPVKAIGAIIGALGGFTGATNAVVKAGGSFVQKLGDVFSKIGDVITNSIKTGDFSNVVHIIDQVLLGGVLVAVRNVIKKFGSGIEEDKPGLFDTIKESFESLTTTMQAMQTKLKSDILIKIAVAIALLSASVVALSFVNVVNLTKALSAMTIMFGNLILTLTAVTKVAGSTGVVKMAVIGVALNLLATAILILAGAVAILAQFNISQLASALATITGLLAALIAATTLMSGNSKGTISAAIAMQILAVALNLLAIAVARLGKLDFGTLAKGIGAIAALLIVLGLFSKFSGDTLVSTAASMVILAGALLLMTLSVKQLGALSLGTLAKGIGSIAAILLILAGAMAIMSSNITGALSLVIVAGALLVLSDVVKKFGAESWGSIVKGLVLLAGTLLIIAAAMALMVEALPGAAALLVVAGALAILTPIIVVLGNLSWDSILKALAALAGVFLLLGVAGLVLGPVVPILLGIGVAVALFGVGILALGAGVALLAVGITALAISLEASGVAILEFVKSLLDIVPLVFKELGEGIISFAEALSGGVVALTNAFVAIFTAMLNGIIKVVPLASKASALLIGALLAAINKDSGPMITTFGNLILLLLTKMSVYYPKFVEAGFQLVINVLNGIAKKIPGVVDAAVSIITAFIKAIGAGATKISQAGFQTVITFLNALATQIRTNAPKLHQAGLNLASAIIEGIVTGLLGTSALNAVKAAAESLASHLPGWMKKILGIHSPSTVMQEEIALPVIQGIIAGFTKYSDLLNPAITNVGTGMISTLQATMSSLDTLISGNLDLQPRITPVVDLTEAKKGFSQLGALSKNGLINAGTSASLATSISAANAAAAAQAGLVTQGSTVLEFNQYNTSPAALSTIDIYRQTKNQISAAKGVLAGRANAG